ncbi:ABC transporter substrate-binding protein [Microlunatus speluncae]|uniref:ABC transporter substrate-binding protein n=1 Tax=Microlunatus speluncae TaxID=2594267 RepID=UPI001C2D8DDD|nr:sugar ABC transporter substrate-binding protein [Microlunatus speluncae]
MGRTDVRGVALLAALLLVTALAGCGDPAARANEVKVTLANHVWSTAIQKLIPEFEAETGLDVTVSTLGENQLSDQYNVKLNAGTDDIDVMMFRPLQEGRQFIHNKWLADLTDRTGDAAYRWDDFMESARGAVSDGDRVYGVPLITEREILYYNADLLRRAGIDGPPETLDDLITAARQVKERVPDTFGFVARGQRSPAVTQFSSYLFSCGGDFDDGTRSTLNTPEAIRAYEIYTELLREVGPPGTSNMNWPDAFAVFQQGRAAFLTDADSLFANLTDPEKSRVADQVGFARFPAGSAGSKPYNVTSWGLAINDVSTHQDNAWRFVQWATSPEVTLRMQQAGTPSARDSVWADPSSTANLPPELVRVIKDSFSGSVGHDRPRLMKVPQARDIVGGPLVTGQEGGDIAAAAAKAAEEYNELLAKERR